MVLQSPGKHKRNHGFGLRIRVEMVLGSGCVVSTHRPQSSSFLGVPYRILNMNTTKELLWGLWVGA